MIEEALELMFSHPAPSPAARIRPCLIGNTGSGKTSRVNAVAEKLGLPVHRILLGTSQPEDVLGLPVVKNGVTRWTLPEWAAHAAKERCVLFLDELDKAMGEQLSVALTLLAEGRVRDVMLHPDTIIVAAMQPVEHNVWLAEETGRAISARLAFLTCPYDWSWFNVQYGLDLSALPTQPLPEPPVLENPSPRHVEYAISLLAKHGTTDVVDYILDGMFTSVVKDVIKNAWNERNQHIASPVDFAKAIHEEPDRIEALSVQEIVALAPDILQHCGPDVWKRAFVRVWTEGNEDDAKAFMENAYDELRRRAEENNDEIEVAAGASEEDVAAALEEAAAEIAQVWESRNKSGES